MLFTALIYDPIKVHICQLQTNRLDKPRLQLHREWQVPHLQTFCKWHQAFMPNYADYRIWTCSHLHYPLIAFVIFSTTVIYSPFVI